MEVVFNVSSLMKLPSTAGNLFDFDHLSDRLYLPPVHWQLKMPDFRATHDPNATNSDRSPKNGDLEKSTDLEQRGAHSSSPTSKKQSVYKGLGWLDRLLVLWILLAIIIGILLGNYVPSVGPALQKGKFVQVSVPIGKRISPRLPSRSSLLTRR